MSKDKKLVKVANGVQDIINSLFAIEVE